MPFAVPNFVAENGAASEYAANIARVVASDLQGTGLFEEIPAAAHIAQVTSFDAPVCLPGLEGDQRAGVDHRGGFAPRVTGSW